MVILGRLRRYVASVAGVAIGVAGLVALGAISERLLSFIDGGHRFVLGQVSVAGRGLGMGTGFTAGGLLPAGRLRAIRDVPGVAGVQAQVMLPLDASASHFLTLTQEIVLGLDLSVPIPNRHYRTLPVARGRFLRQHDRRRVVLGAALAASRRLDVGGALALDGQPYEVVGVLERMLTAPDRFAIVPIEDARELWVAKDAMLRTLLASGAMALRADDLNTGAAVGWRDGEDPDAVARRIRAQVPEVHVQLPGELAALLRSSTAFVSALMGGIAALGFTLGGLALASTVAAAVFERIRDFGIKRALGATDLQLGREVLAETLVVTGAGTVLGVLLAVAAGTGIDRLVAESGRPLFHYSARLLAAALAFALLLATVVAAHATARLVRLTPAEAIRRGS